MAFIGRVNRLTVASRAPQGVYLDAAWLGKVLLPNRYVPEECEVGDKLSVFIYLDSDDRYIATTQRPRAQVGEVAFLKVAEVNNVGAFLDWGLAKELLVPYGEQKQTMVQDQSYLVYVYSDEESNRIAASSKLNQFISHNSNASEESYEKGQAVELAISDKTDLGYAAVVDHKHWGLLFYDDVVKPLNIGQKVKGFIKRVREDGKLDVSLHAPGFAKVDDLSAKVLREMKQNDGFLALNDKSPPESIYQLFSVSKKAFKMTIGNLYKKRLITIDADGIRLVEMSDD